MESPLAREIQRLGIETRARIGAADLIYFKRLKISSRTAEVIGRVVLHFSAGPWSWLTGMLTLAYSLALEAQLNHTVMHGAFENIPCGEKFTPASYESIALPFRSKTWGDAHAIHHGNPSLLEKDPDTVHPLFRVHRKTTWKPWHLLNGIPGSIFVFEFWAFDYDRFLKSVGKRDVSDRGEIKKFALFLFYQYALFPLLAGPHWKSVLLGNVAAVIVRNLVFVGLQTASSVGHSVSTLHPTDYGKKTKDEWYRFQIETSKNFRLRGVWKIVCGGLDRHIEHHLFPKFPPNRLHEISPRLSTICLESGVRYVEFNGIWASLRDSFSYLRKLARP